MQVRPDKTFIRQITMNFIQRFMVLISKIMSSQLKIKSNVTLTIKLLQSNYESFSNWFRIKPDLTLLNNSRYVPTIRSDNPITSLSV